MPGSQTLREPELRTTIVDIASEDQSIMIVYSGAMLSPQQTMLLSGSYNRAIVVRP